MKMRPTKFRRRKGRLIKKRLPTPSPYLLSSPIPTSCDDDALQAMHSTPDHLIMTIFITDDMVENDMHVTKEPAHAALVQIPTPAHLAHLCLQLQSPLVLLGHGLLEIRARLLVRAPKIVQACSQLAEQPLQASTRV